VFAAVLLAFALLLLGLLHVEENRTLTWLFSETARIEASSIDRGLPWGWLIRCKHEYIGDVPENLLQLSPPGYYDKQSGISLDYVNLALSFYAILGLEGLAVLWAHLLRRAVSRMRVRFAWAEFLAAGLCGIAAHFFGDSEDGLVVLAFFLLAPGLCLVLTWDYRGYVAPVTACFALWASFAVASAVLGGPGQTVGESLSGSAVMFTVDAVVVILFEFFRLEFSWSKRPTPQEAAVSEDRSDGQTTETPDET